MKISAALIRFGLAFACLAAGSLAPAFGQVLFSGSYSENFDEMGTAGTATPAGWFVRKGDTGAFTTAITTNAGGVVNSGVYNYGNANYGGGTSNRALVGITSTTTTTTSNLELQLTNNTGAAITTLTLSFTGVQWYEDTAAKTLQFSYSLDGTSFTRASAFDFTSPATAASASTMNSAGNPPQTQAIGGTLTLSAPLAAGATLDLLWYLPSAASANSVGLGIDNVSITSAVPEPGTIALALVGALALILGRSRRGSALAAKD